MTLSSLVHNNAISGYKYLQLDTTVWPDKILVIECSKYVR